MSTKTTCGLLFLCFYLLSLLAECEGQSITNVIGQYRRGTWRKRAVSRVNKLVVHYSVMRGDGADNVELRALQNVHQNSNKWPGLSYHYVITKNGKIYQINAHDELTWTDTINVDSIAILLHGYFNAPVNQDPTAAQLNSARWLLRELMRALKLTKSAIMGHRERIATSCPGDRLFPSVVSWRNNGVGEPAAPSVPTNNSPKLPLGGIICIKSPVNLRESRVSGRIIKLLNPGITAKVTKGPVAEGGYNWYGITVGKDRGWAAQGDGWLQQCTTVNTNSPLSKGTACVFEEVNLRQTRCTGTILVTLPFGSEVNVIAGPTAECGHEWYDVSFGNPAKRGWVAAGPSGNRWLGICTGASNLNETLVIQDDELAGLALEAGSVNATEDDYNETLPLGAPDIYVGENAEDVPEEAESASRRLVFHLLASFFASLLCLWKFI